MLDDKYPSVKAGPPRPSGLIQPRVFSMPPGTERYVVEGSGAILIRLEAGDRLEVQNTEGGQPCEIVCADPKGASDPGILGVPGQAAPTGLMALVTSGDPSLRSLRLGLQARGIELSQARAITLFDSQTPAGTAESFTATREGVAIIAAPGGIMDFETQDTATPLTVMVRRAVITQAPRF